MDKEKKHIKDEQPKEPCACGNDCDCGKTQSDEYLLLAQRIKAEFENYKKRNADIVSISFDNGVVHAVEKILPAIDSFKQARKNIADENVLKGLDMILNQILNGFSSLGVSKIECVGKAFDPNYHNAVLVEADTTKEDGVVLDELQEGFMYKDRVVRHSVVKINKLS